MGISSGQSFRRVRQSLFWASVFFGLLIGSLCLRADEVSTAFDQANKLYEQGKYGEAASGYGKLAQAGQVSSALYFNLGNALGAALGGGVIALGLGYSSVALAGAAHTAAATVNDLSRLRAIRSDRGSGNRRGR